jgi:hypothetical protein
MFYVMLTAVLRQCRACVMCVCTPGVLWCMALFSDLTPELWNAATSMLAAPQAAAALQPAALTLLYQVRPPACTCTRQSEVCYYWQAGHAPDGTLAGAAGCHRLLKMHLLARASFTEMRPRVKPPSLEPHLILHTTLAWWPAVLFRGW